MIERHFLNGCRLTRKRLDRDKFDLAEMGLIEHLKELRLKNMGVTERTNHKNRFDGDRFPIEKVGQRRLRQIRAYLV